MGKASACFLSLCINQQALFTFQCVEDSLLEILVVGKPSVQKRLQGKVRV